MDIRDLLIAASDALIRVCLTAPSDLCAATAECDCAQCEAARVLAEIDMALEKMAELQR